MRTGHSDFHGEDISLRLVYLAGYVVEIKVLKGLVPSHCLSSLLGKSVESPEAFRRARRKCRSLTKKGKQE